MNPITAQLKIRKQQTNKKNRFLNNIGTGFSYCFIRYTVTMHIQDMYHILRVGGN